MNAHANLCGILADLGDYSASIDAGEAGARVGFFFDLAYNFCRSMKLSNWLPHRYKPDILELCEAISQCVGHGEAIISDDSTWIDERRFGFGLVKQCREVAYLAGMSDSNREMFDVIPETVAGARQALDALNLAVGEI
jgi:hypothetical protein